MMYLQSTVHLHMEERGGGMCLVAVKYESLVFLPIYAPHELQAIIPTSMSHTVM